VHAMVPGHHVHAEDSGDDCQEPSDQGAPLQERPGKTRRM
jgi:hypothetical protein